MAIRKVSLSSRASKSKRSSTSSTGSKKRPPVFPKRLYEMLENAETEGYDHLISWLPDGTSFKIHAETSASAGDQEELIKLLKSNFNQTKFKSFLRQLQLYGFERTYKGTNRGVVKHAFFSRGRKDLLLNKSIGEFQCRPSSQDNNRRSSIESNDSAETVQQILKPSTPDACTRVFGTKVESDESTLPSLSCPLISKTSGSWHFRQSGIPMQLKNLVIDDMTTNSDDSGSDELSLVMAGVGDETASLECDEEYWMGMELKILGFVV